jgi:dephospho-CoA kinase
MGKSTAAAFLAQWHIPVIDTDVLARELVEPGQPALEEIRGLFGNTVFDAQDQLDRMALARIIFADSKARHALESILHPRIRTRWQETVEQWRAEGTYSCVVVAIPLLFETGGEAAVDFVLCVACSRETQLARLQERGWTPEHLEQRIVAQWPVEKKMMQSHAVVWTEPDLDVHKAQMERVISRLTVQIR